jgi:hypothetical protein
MSGSIRRTQAQACRFIASRQSPPWFALPDGTARRAQNAGRFEPGTFFSLRRAFQALPGLAPSFYAILLSFSGTKVSWEATRRNFHE